jgi:hypothetical protein
MKKPVMEILRHCPFKTDVWVPGRSFVVHPTEKNWIEVEAKKTEKINIHEVLQYSPIASFSPIIR